MDWESSSKKTVQAVLPFDNSDFSDDEKNTMDKSYHRYHSKKWGKHHKKQKSAIHARWLETHREYNSLRCKKWYIANRARSIVKAAKLRSEKLGLPFNLDQHVDAIQRRIDAGYCELSGVKFDTDATHGKTRVRPNAPSLDRINPSQGYVYSNIRIIVFALNLMFLNWGHEEAFKIAEGWVDRTRNKDSQGDAK